MFSFFRYLLQGFSTKSPLRPPGALPEKEFLKRCIKCNKCAQVCPYYSIRMAHAEWGRSMGTPMINPRDIPCYVCMKCPPVCPTGALQNNVEKKEEVKMGIAKINTETCLPFMGIICRACYENCPIFREAIILEDELLPKVIAEKCIGCGICERVCPVEGSAIIVYSQEEITV
ncbi:MAG: 4Fe-4S dicluster domain-containing protein [Ignavibacteriales bacterium]|jgi:MauM/NapG family ferredoxin protein|nr:4Fe-4S dicluster domain-containing protein [Ignavibacteriaceae bacterium]NLH59993.1 4Fe-4S dicluster domain-containing protein [Ignavibacteriales bacterium]HPO54929.1 4Fe-4S dicluster domain-containing protein [Ignavibacteriaceae bacterium]